MPIHLHRSCRVAAATDQDPPERITPFDSNSKEHAHLKLDDKLLSQGVKQPDVVDRKEEVLRGMRGAQRMSFTLYETFLQMVSRPEEDWSDMHRILEELYGDRWETVFEELHSKPQDCNVVVASRSKTDLTLGSQSLLPTPLYV